MCQHTKETSWTFVGTCGYATGQALSTLRKPVAEHTQLDDPDQMADIIWAVMQSHLLVKRLIRNKFKSDKVVQHALSNFMMKNRVDKSSLDVMDAKVNQNTKDVKDVKQQQTTSVAEQKTLKTTLQNLSKTVEKLQREKKDK